MKIYIAIPKAILDMYWNGALKESEALGMFCVTPIVKKGLLGKQVVTGFKEVITGEKLVNRYRYATEYGLDFEYADYDARVENELQVGDLSWKILDKSTADTLLPLKKLEKLLSQTPEEVQKQLQSVRDEAKIKGQEYKNLESKDSYKKKCISSNELYLAIPKAITEVYWNKLFKKSRALGMFCVTPIIKQGLLGKQTVIGFKEVITGEKLVDRYKCATEYGLDFEYVDVDTRVENEYRVGDLSWEILDKSTADRLLPPKELERLLSQTPEEVEQSLEDIRIRAKMRERKVVVKVLKK